MADLNSYRMHTQLLLAEGRPAAISLRDQLRLRGFDGWTERDTRGYWNGRPVGEQTEFEIQTVENEVATLADALVHAHRRSQPDGVFQLTYIHPDGQRTLVEARAQTAAPAAERITA